ncbi:MAG: helix-turn-helix transcriptional regulator [Candidatus Binataceae bacterium]|nr:helix-turn-helix transcriptional regulator [Candidatus Binataceae bacterium]
MARKRIKSADRPPALPHFLKQWRKFRKLTQEELASRAGTTASTISELEHGNQRYTQQLLEALARELQTHPGLILLRAPDIEAEAWLILEGLPALERKRAMDLLRVLADRPQQAAE